MLSLKPKYNRSICFCSNSQAASVAAAAAAAAASARLQAPGGGGGLGGPPGGGPNLMSDQINEYIRVPDKMVGLSEYIKVFVTGIPLVHVCN